MNMGATLGNTGVVNWFMREINPPPARDRVEYHVDDIVRSIASQKDREDLSPQAVKERLTGIANTAKKLDRLIRNDDPGARAARGVMAVGQAEFNEFHRGLEDLVSGEAMEGTEFIPELRPLVEEYTRRVSAAARELNELLSEDTFPARALRRQLCASGTDALAHRLQTLETLATTSRVSMPSGLTAFFAPAEVARLGMKATSGGRPIDAAKIVAVWGSYLLFMELGLEITDDPDDIFCRLSGYAYEAATDEQDADLSHAVKLFIDDLRRFKIDKGVVCQEKRSADTS